MGFTYGGLVGNVTYPGVWAGNPFNYIASTVKGNPTTVNTQAPHNLLTGDIVDITDHQVCTGVNGVNLPVIMTSPTQFTVPVDTSTYTSGGLTGIVWPRAYTANRTTIPVDGDPNDASTYAPGFMSASDQNAFAIYQTGAWRLVNLTRTNIHTDPTYATAWAYVKNPSGVSGSAGGPVVIGSIAGSTPYGSLMKGTTPLNVAFGDYVEVQLDFSYKWVGGLGSNANQNIFFALNYAYYVPGTATPTFTQQVDQSGKVANAQIISSAQTVLQGSMSLRGLIQPGTLQGSGAVDTAGLFDCQLYAGQGSGTSADTPAELVGDAQFMFRLWRPNIPAINES
jgi:hypothetical protein